MSPYALSPETNQVSVAGGGSAPNSAGDPTTIVTPDFTISLSGPTPATVIAGAPATYLVTVASVGGFSTNVGLSAPGLPTGAAAFFSPATITGSGTSTLTITAPPSGTGNFTVTANGLSGPLTHNAAAVLAVQDYTLTLSPYNSASPPTIPSGGTQTFTIGAAGLNGFTGNIALGLYPYNVNGLPTCNFASLSLPSSVAAGSAVTVTMEPNSTYCFFQINGAGQRRHPHPERRRLRLQRLQFQLRAAGQSRHSHGHAYHAGFYRGLRSDTHQRQQLLRHNRFPGVGTSHRRHGRCPAGQPVRQ
ncbi:MAG TPA: hypothetical protein VMQ86_08065 [Bryobacteraceae bacterium]|nr:hypothetical protein [Bryobacteraceae bacterium]